MQLAIYKTPIVSLRPLSVLLASLCAVILLLPGCAANTGLSGPQIELAKQERRAKHDREQRAERREKRERREAKDWAAWIADQEREPGPVVLERGDLVLKAAIARAQYGGSGATRLTHLRMTAAARELIVSGNTERALDLLERAIGVDGSEGFAYLYLGYVYVRRGDVERASGFLGQARRLLPPDPDLRAEVRWLDSLAAVGPPEDTR